MFLIGGVSNKDVLVISGTLPSITNEDRQSLMNLCPEMKVFYPALHDPSCFGAKPNGDKCALRLIYILCLRFLLIYDIVT